MLSDLRQRNVIHVTRKHQLTVVTVWTTRSDRTSIILPPEDRTLTMPLRDEHPSSNAAHATCPPILTSTGAPDLAKYTADISTASWRNLTVSSVRLAEKSSIPHHTLGRARAREGCSGLNVKG